MNTTIRITIAERFGRWLGRSWRGYMRGERLVSAWLEAKGVPVSVAATLVWVAKLVVLGMLLYVAFWVAVLALSVVVGMWVASQNHTDDTLDFEFQFPTTIEELRETPGYDPNLYGDTSHEMYRVD